MAQREKPGISPQQLNVTLGMPADTPTKVSGGMIEDFREGWALNIMPAGQVGHYYKRVQFDTAVSRCGHRCAVRWLYGVGNFGRCQRCLKSIRNRPGLA